MKIRTLLFIAATITFSALKAQDYEIVNVDPDTLDKGENILTITLNKEIVDYDSIIIHFDGPTWDYHCYEDDLSWVDSIITATVEVPYYVQNQEGVLGMEMINTTDWSYEELIYDKPVLIKKSVTEYNIQNVEGEYLIPGEESQIVVTFDQMIVDSVNVFIRAYENGIYKQDYYPMPWQMERRDSILTIEIDIPAQTPLQDGVLNIEIVNTIDWISQYLVAEDTLIIGDPLTSRDYQIQSVTPEYLIDGTMNEITVTLNREIAAEDSAFVTVSGYVDGTFTNLYYPFSNDPADSVIYWNDSTITAIIDIPELSQVEKGVLHVEMINTKYWTSTTLTYDDTLSIGGTIHSFVPEICMVSVDSLNRNMIIWEPDYEDYVDSIIIYKETTVADEFEIIGKKSIQDTPTFVDEESVNAPNSIRYCIALQDKSGVLSKLSAPHKTMHLTMNVGVNNAINLIWEKYEGFDYSTFHIYRGSSKGEMVKISEIPSNLFTFTDQNPSLFHLYYQVVIENPSPCDISKSTQDIFSTTKSNFVEYLVSSNEFVKNAEFTVHAYPNPVSDYLTINIDNMSVKAFDVEIHDLSGRSVRNYSSISNGNTIDLSNLKAGIYRLIVRSNGINQNKIIIKE